MLKVFLGDWEHECCKIFDRVSKFSVEQCYSLLERFEKFHNCLRLSTACLGMCNQWDSVRTSCVDRIWIGVERGFDDFQFSQHGCSKEIKTRAVFKQIVGNVFPAHVCGRAKTRFPVPATPIP